MRIEKKDLYPVKHVPAVLAAAWAGRKSGRKPDAVGPDNFPIFADDPLKALHLLTSSFLEDSVLQYAWMVDPTKPPSGQKLLAGDPRWRGQAILAGAARVVWFWKSPRWDKELRSLVYDDKWLAGLRPLLSALFQTEFELTEQETIDLARLLSGPVGEEIAEHVPSLGVVMAVQAMFSVKPLSPAFRRDLMILLRRLITLTVCKERADESGRIARKLGASEAVAQMDNPNMAFKRLAELLLTEEALVELVDEVRQPLEEVGHWFSQTGAVSALLDLLEPFLASHPMPDRVRTGLKSIQNTMEAGRVHKTEQRELGRIRALLGGPRTVEIEPGEAWSDQARADLLSFDSTVRIAWDRLLAHCTTAESSKPANKWVATANEMVNALGRAEFKNRVLQWFSLVARPRPIHREPTYPRSEPDPDLLITNRNATILKGLAWCCADMKDTEISQALSDLAEVCFKKVRWLGPRCPRVGNACLYSLTRTASEDAAAQLSKLDQVVKQPTAKKRIGKSLDIAAEATGQSRADLEEKSVPAFGLGMDGKLAQSFGSHTAELRVVESRDVRITWMAQDGSPLKSVPAEVKRDHATELKQLQKLGKEIEKMLGAQRIRIERLMMTERDWEYETWRRRYLEQPLLAPIVRRLLWHFKRGDQSALAASLDGKLVDVQSRPLDWLDSDTRVRLWHPIGYSVETISAWRRWLEANKVCQPFKQAHREIYILTDAELRTATYSNRFAAHIIGQHQFAALAMQRGWKYSFMGGFDFQNTPTLELPSWNLTAEFWVDATGEPTESGVARYLTTDQVRFLRDGQPVPLTEVPAPVFTEVLRDVDLFVGVCSVGNDPSWQDNGEIEGGGNYWRSYSFGDLSATAKTRREVLDRLVPKLRVANQCALQEKYLVVTGSFRTYKIHLGSGNILMEPNDQYLCIVPERGGASLKSDNVFLPFEGDTTLAVILSKAFLLAEDSTIKDQSILSQINSHHPT